MNKLNFSAIDKDWPKDELETINACPYCSSSERKLVYKDVQDWSFYCSPGRWDYFECCKCGSLYLAVRPNKNSIGQAYSDYYTHDLSDNFFKKKFKLSLKNECFSQWLSVNIKPRLKIPKILAFLFIPFKAFLFFPYELEYLVNLPKGKLLDVGCGSGGMLQLANSLGWEAIGLEIDKNAVNAAKKQSLNVIEGGYEKLELFSNNFDCIVCSHVLEHVHNPISLINHLFNALKPGGLLFLSLPNAQSHLRFYFGDSWRGLEAPRHISIPTLKKSIECLNEIGFVNVIQKDIFNITYTESLRIKEQKLSISKLRFIFLKLKLFLFPNVNSGQSDFIQLVAYKKY